MQQNATIEVYRNQNTSTGEATFEVVFPPDGAGSAQVIVAVTSTTSGSSSVAMDEWLSEAVTLAYDYALTIYDASYIALASHLNCLFYTADSKLSDKVKVDNIKSLDLQD